VHEDHLRKALLFADPSALDAFIFEHEKDGDDDLEARTLPCCLLRPQVNQCIVKEIWRKLGWGTEKALYITVFSVNASNDTSRSANGEVEGTQNPCQILF
jgi:hypothetical protein